MIFLAKAIISLIFIASGAMKIVNPEGFTANVESFQIFPHFLVPAIVATVPLLEILAGILIHTKRMGGPSALSLTVLSTGFCLLYAAMLILGITPDCGCFGENPFLKATPVSGFWRGLALMALTGGVWAKSLGIKRLCKIKPPTGTVDRDNTTFNSPKAS